MEADTIISGTDALLKISGKFGIRLVIDVVFVILLLKFIYFKNYKNKDLLFTYFVFNVIIFSVSFLLNKIDISLGAAFGLFAVFGMLRYKTEEITIKEMTYLFLNIAIGLICAVTKIKGTEDIYEYIFLITLNLIIFCFVYLLESNIFLKRESFKVVNYSGLENTKPENQHLIIDEIKKRTGLNITRIIIQKIDLIKDTAQVKIYYHE